MVRKDGQRIWIDVSGVQLSSARDESMWMLVDITAMKRHEAKLDRLASFDALTGVLTRRLLEDHLSQAIARARRHEHVFAVLYLDLDGFKPINDTFGHQAGDHVLKVVASRIVGSVRITDRVARVGGDEFVIVLDGVEDDRAAVRVAEKILRFLAEPIPFHDGQRVSVCASIGISMFPSHGQEIDTLLARADQAMYESKTAGRNRLTLFSDCETEDSTGNTRQFRA
jgi:diguanylate cyclase (GGDEF)-like protein